MAAGSEFSLLFRKYVDGVASHEERLAFLSLVDQEEMQAELAQLVDAELRLRNTAYILDEEEQQEILNNIYSAAPAKPVTIRKMVFLWPRIGVAAAAVAAITLGTWLYYTTLSSRVPRDLNRNAIQNDIAPGRNTATLTLANGKTINLSDTKKGITIDASTLTYNDGEELSISSESGPRRGGPEVSSETTQFSGSRDAGSRVMSVSTPRGGTYEVTLPDGTKVWLNADSKIDFPSQFIGAQRKILLTGEAYFEVTKNKAKPFIVESAGQRVEVLGTHFNINNYADEGSTKTTLLEGSVEVSSSSLRGTEAISKGGAVILKPNQQSLLTGGKIKIETIDPELAIAWKNNKFIFENDNIQYIMRMVARWYNVEVRYEGDITTETFGGAVSRYENISEVLKPLEATGKVKFKIEGRTIIVGK